uniref:phenylacetate--CoA ligase family protein n=1 Tax=Arsukibacterium sp. TaxID=1977258 RepID=UPI002FDAE2C9
KTLIREHSQQLFSLQNYRYSRGSTGGSSGQPLTFYMDQHRVSHDVAAKLRATRWWGVDIGDPEAVIWGAPIELGKQSTVKTLRDKLFRSVLMPALTLTPELINQQLQQLIQQKPAMIFGYPSVIYRLCLAAKQQQLALDQLGVKVVFVTSEMLYPHERAVISNSFNCPVANGYGARDAGFIAHECPAGKMHISAEDIIVELIDEQGQPVAHGEIGEIVTTHLATPGYPFIRYRTGDLARLDPSPCSCGRGLPVLAEVQGRRRDFLLTTKGDQLHSWGVVYLLRDLTDIDKFKMIQHTKNQIELLIVANKALSSEQQSQLRQQFQTLLGADMNIDIQQVQDIPASANGKYCYVENKLAS